MAGFELGGRVHGGQPECCPYCFLGYGEIMYVPGHTMELTLAGVRNSANPGPDWSLFDGVKVLPLTTMEPQVCGCLLCGYGLVFSGPWTLDDGTVVQGAIYHINLGVVPRDFGQYYRGAFWSMILHLRVFGVTNRDWTLELVWDEFCQPKPGRNVSGPPFADALPTAGFRLISGV